MAQITSYPPPFSRWKLLFHSSHIAFWEVGGVLFSILVGGFLHFAFELSNYSRAVAFIGSVNESTWEHLKFYFWAGLLYSLIEYTYVRAKANNYLFAKAMNFLVTPIVLCIAFYAYVGVVVPLYGEGGTVGAILTGFLGVVAGYLVSSYYMQHPPLPNQFKYFGLAIILILGVMFSLFTYYPPEMFLFEDFYGYEYTGQYGILEDYEPYKVFR